MSLYGAFDKTKHFDELNEPLFSNEGVKSPSQRKAEARENLDIEGGLAAGVTGARFANQPLVNRTATAVDATATMTVAAVMGGLITSTSAAAVSATMPLGSALETALLSAFPALAVGDSFQFTVRNTGPNTFTIVTNTGWTLAGDVAIETATTGSFLVRRTAADTYTLDRI